MKIQTLKDLKLALKDIPDEILESYGAGCYEDDFVQLLIWDMDESDAYELASKNSEKYPQLDDIGKWIENISHKSQSDEYFEEPSEEPISSEDFKEKDEKSSPFHEDKLKEMGG